MARKNNGGALDFTPRGRTRERAVTEAVCDYFGVDETYLLARLREEARSFARQVWMTVLYHDVAMTYTHVGVLTVRDHSTVMHGIHHVGALAERGDEPTMAALASIRALYPLAGRLSPADVVRLAPNQMRLDGDLIDHATYHRAPLILVPDTSIPLPRLVSAGSAGEKMEEMEARYFQIQARRKREREVSTWVS